MKTDKEFFKTQKFIIEQFIRYKFNSKGREKRGQKDEDFFEPKTKQRKHS